MKTRYITTINQMILVLLLFINIQCNRFVEVVDPTDQISQTTVFKDKATAFAALADVYANMRSNSLMDGTTRGAHFLTSCYTDELATISNQPGGFSTFYELSVQASNSNIDQLWTSTYRNIYAVNNILEGVAQSSDYLDESTRNTLNGEALAIRALFHLYLTQLFGAIPYVETTDYHTNQTISKSTLSQLYANIKRDLQLAETLLTDGYPTSGRTRLNKAAVQLLLARTSLYEGNNAQALNYANLVMENPAYAIEPSLDKVFLKDAKSTIWQFAPIEPGANTLEAGTFIIWDTPPPYAFLNGALLSSFEPGDLRATQWIASASGHSHTFYYSYKYKEFEKTPISGEYSVILRLEEAILIAAEAENKLGNPSTALQKINMIRSRAGLTTPTVASQQEVTNLIVDERLHEFFTEGGHRFFDLKRWGLLDGVMTIAKPNWQNHMKNWPLPERELLINPNLNPQNNGY